MSKNCHTIHQWFNGMKKHSFPFNEQEIPLNGIYILFEKGEFAHSTNRIVRIGTHTGNNQLRSRLFQHFLNENKDRSIFRKNIGRALLNKDEFVFLAGNNYRKFLLPHIKNYKIPMLGLGIGKQLKWLTKRIKHE